MSEYHGTDQDHCYDINFDFATGKTPEELEEERLFRKAEIGYSTYREYAGGRSLVTGSDLPDWPDVATCVKAAWFAAAKAILAEE